MNKVMIIGNLGRDPEIRHMQDGNKVVQLAVATNESWKDKNTGERRDKTEWHRVVVFNQKIADVVERYLKKGSKVYIEGQLQTRKWSDQSGMERYTTEIVLQRYRGELMMLDKVANTDHVDVENDKGHEASSINENVQQKDDFDDEIPF